MSEAAVRLELLEIACPPQRQPAPHRREAKQSPELLTSCHASNSGGSSRLYAFRTVSVPQPRAQRVGTLKAFTNREHFCCPAKCHTYRLQLYYHANAVRLSSGVSGPLT